MCYGTILGQIRGLSLLSPVFIITGSGCNNGIINITKPGIKLGQEKCQAILWLHIFTGCVSISTFILKKKDKTLGANAVDIIFDVEKFVCALYGQKDSSCVNVARYILFRLTYRSENMPPNQDCLKHDIAGVNYQTAIHRRCPERFIDAPSAVGHGWQVEDGQLVHKWMDNSPVQQSVLKSINCKHKKSGCKDNCSCLNLSDLFICTS